jgi:hypothetical protein
MVEVNADTAPSHFRAALAAALGTPQPRLVRVGTRNARLLHNSLDAVRAVLRGTARSACAVGGSPAAKRAHGGKGVCVAALDMRDLWMNEDDGNADAGDGANHRVACSGATVARVAKGRAAPCRHDACTLCV